ncbi:effector-associated constant component EACC1 [Microbispora sp. CA-102843]|uniref:effector-associated constant component EACC1 n=1 Tax=Microbispora sp. CA-102843 TaxID=3239952 RepID=UPI003D8F3C3D
MRVGMRVRGGGRASGEQEKELAAYLDGREQLRGRVHLVDERRRSAGMSQSVASVLTELGPYAVVFATALISWIRHRTSDTTVTVRRQDGAEFEVSAQRVRGLGAAQLRALVEQIAQVVDNGGAPAGPSTGDPTGTPSNIPEAGRGRAEAAVLPPGDAGLELALEEVLRVE